jgi:hypothetical protein
MIEWSPTESVLISRVATPLVIIPVPSVVEPLTNVTIPVGDADPVLPGVIVAVSTTLSPKTGALGEKVRAVVVVGFPTVTVTTGEVLEVNVLSPEY